MAWTAEQVEKLRGYVLAGYSGGQIAKQLQREFPGCGYTRCAVRAKVDRLGLVLKGAASPAQRLARRASDTAREALRRVMRQPAQEPRAPMAIVSADVTHFPGAVLFDAAQYGQCRFILNDPRAGAIVCGAAADGIYCDAHRALCSAGKPEEKKRKCAA